MFRTPDQSSFTHMLCWPPGHCCYSHYQELSLVEWFTSLPCWTTFTTAARMAGVKSNWQPLQSDISKRFVIICLYYTTVDGTAPVVVCVEDITETTPLGTGGRTVTWTTPTATDNSGVVILTERSHAPGQFFQTGNTAVTYRFTDGTGNEATCVFGVTVFEGMYALAITSNGVWME